MTNYLPSDWRPSESMLQALQKQGYTLDELISRYLEWKVKLTSYAQRKDVRGQLNANETWDTRFHRMITEQEPEGAEQQKKKRRKVYNAAADPEANRQLEEKLDKIYATKSPNSHDRLKQLREMAGNNRSKE